MARVEKTVDKDGFDLITSGKKKVELRLADLEINEGDTLIMKEWDADNKEYTGREVETTVTYVMKTKDQTFFTPEEVDKYGFQIIQFNIDKS